MDTDKVLEVIKIYREHFEAQGISKIDYPHGFRLDHQGNALAHCHGMLDQMEEFVAQGRMDKVFRWLGFVQGCLWSARVYTLESLKNHNRPPNNAD